MNEIVHFGADSCNNFFFSILNFTVLDCKVKGINLGIVLECDYIRCLSMKIVFKVVNVEVVTPERVKLMPKFENIHNSLSRK